MNNILKKISQIDLHDNSSWENNIFITLDLDWCSDHVLEYTLQEIEKYNIKCTIFVTHDSILLERMKGNENIELGIHPNFNFLLNGDFRYGKNIYEVIEYYKNIVPGAKSVRSHSMTQNSNILEAFSSFELKYDCNTFVPRASNIVLKPYFHWDNKLIKVPYFWEDDISCITNGFDLENDILHKGLKVFDFHPIHLYLNTEDILRYENTKEVSSSELINYRNKNNYGVFNYFNDLIKAINDR